MNDISVLNMYSIGVHPIHKLLIRIQLLQNFMLLFSILELYLILLDFLLLDEISFVLKTDQNNLVSAQVNYRVGENVENFSEYFLD